MPTTVKKLYFANGTNVTKPTDLTLESSTNHLETYASDALFEAANPDLSDGDIYINTVSGATRLYVNGAWWTCVIKENAILVDTQFSIVDNGDGTKVAKFDVANIPTGTTKTFTLPLFPTSSDTLVTENATQELINKTIDGNFNTLTNLDFGTLSGEVNPQNGGTGVANPAGATLTRTGAHDLHITTTAPTNVTMPTSGTIATLTDVNTTQLTGTLAPAKGGLGTNASAFSGVVKADGAGNFSASSVTNTDISATAAIARSKVASGTANHIVVNDAAGALTSEATLAKSRGGSGQDNTNLTFPSTGTLATTSGTETLTAKTLVEPVIDNFAAFNHEATPSSAAAGTVRVYAKSDNKLYKMDSTGAEASIGSGSGAGGINYLSDWNDATKPIGTVLTVAANGNIAVTGSGTPSLTSAWYADTTSAATVTAGSFVIGQTYVIASIGTTNFTLIGAASNTVGVMFTATGVGSGTGTAVASAIFASTNGTLRGSSNYLTQLSGASTSGATFVQSAAFNVDGSDLGKPVTISFDLSGVTTADDWDVVVARYSTTGSAGTGTYVELIPVAGTASSITGTAGAQLPTATTQFKGFFVTSNTASDVYALRLRRRAGTTQVRIDNLSVGPQSLAQGAVVTQWQSYTPTLSAGWGTASGLVAQWMRVGNNIKIRGYFVTGVTAASLATVSFPAGLTSGTLPKSGYNIVGKAYRSGLTSASPSKAYTALMQSNTNVIGFSFSDNGTSSTTDLIVPQNGSALAASDPFHFETDFIPVNEWSSGTTTLADRAVEEYAASTTGTWDAAAAATDTVRGIDGAPITGALSATRIKVVRFSTPILPTDNLFLEIYNYNGNPGWVTASSLGFQVSQQLTQSYGCQVNPVNAGISTDALVAFYQYTSPSTNTYGGAGYNWSNGLRWRLRKVSGGAAVGFPVSARNIVGDTSGTAVPSGYIGEVKSSSASAVSVATTPTTLTSITLTAGTWCISGTVQYYGTSGSANVLAAISTTTNSITGTTRGLNQVLSGTSSADGLGSATVAAYFVNISSSSAIPYYLVGQLGSGPKTCDGSIQAVRIA